MLTDFSTEHASSSKYLYHTDFAL